MIVQSSYLPGLAGLLIFLAACSGKEPVVKVVNPGGANSSPDTKPAFLITKQSINKTLHIPAELLPYERTMVNAKMEAFVKKVNVDIGDRVQTGAILATLEAPEAASRYAEALARSQEAKAQFAISRDKYLRLKEAAKGKGVIAEGELILAKNQMLADSAQEISAQSNADTYKQLQDYLVLRAPFSGVITSRSVDPGDLVGTVAAQPMFTLERVDRLRLRVPVPEPLVAGIPLNQTILFTTEAILNKSFQAVLSRKSGRIDPDTRTEIWEYEVVNKSGELKPGMYSLATLQLTRAEPSIVAPYTAVVTTLEKRFITRIKNGRAEWIDVRQGFSLNEGMEVFGDLFAGDTVLVRGSEEIKPGMLLLPRIE